jgi:hypothetical protein
VPERRCQAAQKSTLAKPVPLAAVQRILVSCVLVFRRGIGIVGMIANHVVVRRAASAGVKTPELSGAAIAGTP